MQDLGLQWLMTRGKIATEEAYPYQGVDNFCSAKGRKHIKFSVSTHPWVFLQSMPTSIGFLFFSKHHQYTFLHHKLSAQCGSCIERSSVGGSLLKFLVHTISVSSCITSRLLSAATASRALLSVSVCCLMTPSWLCSQQP